MVLIIPANGTVGRKPRLAFGISDAISISIVSLLSDACVMVCI